MENFKELDDLLSEIARGGAYIFGAGLVGKAFFKGLKEYGVENFVECFIVSTLKDVSFVDGIPIRQLNDDAVDKSKFVCVAVHESLRDDVFNTLDKNGFNNYVWIYPFLLHLRIGRPILEKKILPIRDIYLATRNSYALFVRYLMIEFFYGENKIGSDLYIKSIALHSSLETAKKRLAQFVDLIKSFETYGFKSEMPISVFENYELFDGNHRFALAIYNGNSNILCNVYQKNISKIE